MDPNARNTHAEFEGSIPRTAEEMVAYFLAFPLGKLIVNQLIIIATFT
jgi:hypothetical protein